jgi:hypothetical protein
MLAPTESLLRLFKRDATGAWTSSVVFDRAADRRRHEDDVGQIKKEGEATEKTPPRPPMAAPKMRRAR